MIGLLDFSQSGYRLATTWQASLQSRRRSRRLADDVDHPAEQRWGIWGMVSPRDGRANLSATAVVGPFGFPQLGMRSRSTPATTWKRNRDGAGGSPTLFDGRRASFCWSVSPVPLTRCEERSSLEIGPPLKLRSHRFM